MEIEDIEAGIIRSLDSLEPPPECESIKHENCSVCLEEVTQEATQDEKQQKLCLLPCKHIFHYQCLIQWILEQSKERSLSRANTSLLGTCPICRLHILGEKQDGSVNEINNISQTAD